MNMFDYFETLTKSKIISGSILISLLIGLIRYLTGPELALSLFYLFPISLAAWYSGKIPGIFMAFFCAFTWLVADLSMQKHFSSPLIPWINESLRLLVFLVVSLLISYMKQVINAHKKTAHTDALTGIPNRLSFIEYGEMEINKNRRSKRSISMIFLDVDNFKAVNDTWGHREGDILLTHVATTLTHVIRATDLAARFGGDEFAILLWRSGSENSYDVARKIKKQLRLLTQLNLMALSLLKNLK